MNVTVSGRHMDVTDSMRRYVESKVPKLTRIYAQVEAIEVTVGLDADKPVVEIVAQARRKHTFVASHRDDDMYACVDRCLDKIAEQIRRHKDRIRDRQGPPHGEALEAGL